MCSILLFVIVTYVPDETNFISADNKDKVDFFKTAVDRHNHNTSFFLNEDKPQVPMKDFITDAYKKYGLDGKITKITPSGYLILKYKSNGGMVHVIISSLFFY